MKKELQKDKIILVVAMLTFVIMLLVSHFCLKDLAKERQEMREFQGVIKTTYNL